MVVSMTIPGGLNMMVGASQGTSEWPFTVLLAHCDEPAGSTTLVDSKGIRNITCNSQQTSSTQKKFGACSLMSGGLSTSSIINQTGATDYVFGTGDFTIEFWVYGTNLYSVSGLLDLRPTSTNGYYPNVYTSGGKLIYQTNSISRISGTTAITLNTWHHVAVCRSSGFTKLFLDGSQEGSTYTDSDNLLCGTNRPIFLALGFISGYSPNAYMDEIRILKGYAAYTANFTPPTAAYPNN